MASATAFDRLFNNLPAVSTEKDYDRFWDRAMGELNRVQIDPEFIPSSKHSSRFNIFEVNFKSSRKTAVNATLHIPKAADRPNPVIVIHDYNHPEPYKGFHLDDSMAYLFLHLRGHEHIREPEKAKPAEGDKDASKKRPSRNVPGYLQESVLDADDFYMKQICLDTIRSIDVLRLNKKINCGNIAVLGRGAGALAAVVAAVYSSRVSALIIDSPLFSWIEESQNESDSDAAFEINEYIKHHHGKKSLVKKTLSYFDSIPLASKIECPVMMSVGLKDKKAPPACSLALFNHLLTDKEIQIYPDDAHEAGGEKQFRKAIAWANSVITS